MKLFDLNSKTYEVEIEPQALLMTPFKEVYDRDKSSNKNKAKLELAFIYFYTDIKSDYQYIIDEKVREEEIIKDLKLGPKWKPDKKVQNAINFYKERSKTAKTYLYESACIAIDGINNYLRNVSTYLANGELDISKATSAIDKVPNLMKNLDAAYNALVKEQRELEGRSKGSKSFNMFEEGV